MVTAEKLALRGEHDTGLTWQIAEFAVRTRTEDIPREVIECAKRSQLDTLGVTIGGVAMDEAPEILARLARQQAGAPVSTVIGMGFQTSPSYAALVNGTAGDVIGFSDVVPETMNHPSTSICAALWALGEKLGSSGPDVLASHAIGLEIAEKFGHGIRPAFQRKGWEPRGVQNTFGAAAACARLLDLDVNQTANALGICGAEASGMRAVKGTMSKAYIAGMAARNGIEAAILASLGYTGPTNVFEARDGVLQTFGEGASAEGIAERLGQPWEFLEPGVTYKAFPLCTCTHTSIEATLALKRDHGISARDVASITCATTPGASDWLPFSAPENKFQAKYSIQFAVAMALLEDGVTVSAVTDDKVREPEVVALIKKISKTILPEYADQGYTPSHAPYGCEVSITLNDGTTHVLRRDRSSWEAATPASWDALADKFRGCAAPILSDRDVESLIGRIAELDKAENLFDVMRLAAGPGGKP
jgi:2-methylcitrate dehydratase PrpD